MAVNSGPGEGHSLDEGSVIIVKHTVKVEAREALRQGKPIGMLPPLNRRLRGRGRFSDGAG